MKVRPTARTALVMSVLLIVCAITGCLRNAPPKPAAQGSAAIAVTIPKELRSKRLASASSFDSHITVLEFVLSKGSIRRRESVQVPEDTDLVTVTFDNLAAGRWEVSAIGKNQAGMSICSASSTVEIRSGDTTPAQLVMKLVSGSLHVTVDFECPRTITSGTVTLTSPMSDPVQEDLDISGNSGSAVFSDIAAMTWPVKIELYSSGELALEGETQVTVNPSEPTFVRIILENGAVRVEIIWNLAPSTPTGLETNVDSGQVQLSWDPNPPSEDIEGYLVYRSTSELAPLYVVSDGLVYGTTFVDRDVIEGESYW